MNFLDKKLWMRKIMGLLMASIFIIGILVSSGCIGQEEEKPLTTTVVTTKPGETVPVTFTTTMVEERDYFKVGVLTSLSGDLARGGHITKRGYDMWEWAINRMAGIKIGEDYYKVQLVYYDAQSDPSMGAKAVEKMILEDEVDFILGPYSSAVTLGSAPIVEKYKVPMITGSAESDLIWQAHYEYTYQTLLCVSLGMNGPLTLITQLKDPVPETIAILAADDPFSKSIGESSKAFLEEQGFEIVLYEIFPRGIEDMSPLISKAKAENPDIFILGAHLENLLGAVRASKELDFNPKLYILHAGTLYPEFREDLGKDADYMIGQAMWIPELQWSDPLFGTAQDFANTYEMLYGKYPPEYTEVGCAATGYFYQMALQQAGLTPPLDEAKREQLKETIDEISLAGGITTSFGPMAYSQDPDKFWHVNTGLPSLACQIQNGEIFAVGPLPEQTQKEVIYPVPTWTERKQAQLAKESKLLAIYPTHFLGEKESKLLKSY